MAAASKWEQIEAQGYEFYDYVYSDPQWLEHVIYGLERGGRQVKKLRVRSDTPGLRVYAVFTKEAR